MTCDDLPKFDDASSFEKVPSAPGVLLELLVFNPVPSLPGVLTDILEVGKLSFKIPKIRFPKSSSVNNNRHNTSHYTGLASNPTYFPRGSI